MNDIDRDPPVARNIRASALASDEAGRGSAPENPVEQCLVTLEYVASMLVELRHLSMRIREPTLVYLVEIAVEHSRDRIRDMQQRLAGAG